MALIFQDRLKATGGSGLYTLLGYGGGEWRYVQTIAGSGEGETELGSTGHTIAVDTSLFLPGQSYPFKWADSRGLESNVVLLTIPAALVLHSIAPAAGGGCLIVFDAAVESGGLELFNLTNGIGAGYGLESPTLALNVQNYTAVIPYLPYISGDSYCLKFNMLL